MNNPNPHMWFAGRGRGPWQTPPQAPGLNLLAPAPGPNMLAPAPHMPAPAPGPNMLAPAAAGSSQAEMGNAHHILHAGGPLHGGAGPFMAPGTPFSPVMAPRNINPRDGGLPWAFRAGDSVNTPVQGRKAMDSPLYEETADECCICHDVKKDLKILERCGHYPFCTDCLKSTARLTASRFKCPQCNAIVVKTYDITMVKPKNS